MNSWRSCSWGAIDSPLDWLTSGSCSQQLTVSNMLACCILLHMGISPCRRPSHPQAVHRTPCTLREKNHTSSREQVSTGPGISLLCQGLVRVSIMPGSPQLLCRSERGRMWAKPSLYWWAPAVIPCEGRSAAVGESVRAG